jgi:valyl-tRNA synthetase
VYTSEKLNLANFDHTKIKINESSLSLLDKWVISRLNSTIKKITELSDRYKLPWITSELRELIITDISRWYIMLNREKLDVYSEDPNKYTIMTILYNVLMKVLLLLCPINPMLTEEIYLKMFKSEMKHLDLEETESIHLQNWPEVDEKKIDLDLEDQMIFTKDLIELIRALKEENKIRLRWPNKKLIIEPKEGMPKISFPDLIKQVGNVKELEIKESIKVNDRLIKVESKYCNVYLDTSLDDELLGERVVNDLIRTIQFTRKKNNFKVGEEIELSLATDAEYLKNYMQNNETSISDKVSAHELEVKIGNSLESDTEASGRLTICSNRQCSASLKNNIVAKLEEKPCTTCPYCNTNLTKDNIKNITFKFLKL